VAPIEPYGLSKAEAENVCRDFGRRGLETVTLRPSAFVGPERLGVFGILFGWVREGRRVYTLGAGTNRYQLLDVDDLVEAILLAAREPVAGETFNVGAAVTGTVAGDLVALIEHAGSRSRVSAVPALPARVVLRTLDVAGLSPLSEWHYRTADQDVVASVERARRVLGWQPRRSSAGALIRAYDWFVASDARAAPGETHRARWPEGALGLVRRIS
jgi:nucleoside-diphosphate-sugar epimerase